MGGIAQGRNSRFYITLALNKLVINTNIKDMPSLLSEGILQFDDVHLLQYYCKKLHPRYLSRGFTYTRV